MPCWGQFHVLLPAGELPAVTGLLPRPTVLSGLQVHPLTFPLELCEWRHRTAWSKDAGQWSLLWADNFSTAEYALMLDSDTAFTFPVTCQTLFDHEGRAMWWYWTHTTTAPWAAASRALFNASSDRNFMAYFPLVVPLRILQVWHLSYCCPSPSSVGFPVGSLTLFSSRAHCIYREEGKDCAVAAGRETSSAWPMVPHGWLGTGHGGWSWEYNEDCDRCSFTTLRLCLGTRSVFPPGCGFPPVCRLSTTRSSFFLL